MVSCHAIWLALVGQDPIYGTEHKAKSGVVALHQHRSDLGRTHNGPEGLDCLIIGKVFRWGQIRTQDALSVTQSPFDQAFVLHEPKTLSN